MLKFNQQNLIMMHKTNETENGGEEEEAVKMKAKSGQAPNRYRITRESGSQRRHGGQCLLNSGSRAIPNEDSSANRLSIMNIVHLNAHDTSVTT
ncbi:hypothetical protein PoB_001563500 [Plakobranchus ocellatus]|uniref:Uncharacterized protein n=1 Tax=Plakobranchus ocellatus TaxID=259542 RepID=A0AAV3Z1V4_9GAST|nr:hypothetical protein PoB_001563500 [Plakobranchus ocellatus]